MVRDAGSDGIARLRTDGNHRALRVSDFIFVQASDAVARAIHRTGEVAIAHDEDIAQVHADNVLVDFSRDAAAGGKFD